MNLILFATDELRGQKLTLSDNRFQQIYKVHRSQAGDSVRLGQIGGLMGTGIIETIDQRQLTLAVTLGEPPPKKLPLRILLALPRPKMLRRIFRNIAELGVSELIVINSYKVEKSFWNSPALAPDKLRGYLLDGLQQAKDTVLPEVRFEPRFKPFVEDRLPELISGQRALLAHPGLEAPCPHRIQEPATLAIGPEGGFTPYEVEKLLEAGFEGIHLGPRILKVENALLAITSKLYD